MTKPNAIVGNKATIPNQALSLKASNTDVKTSKAANSIIKAFGLTESSPMTKSIVLGATYGSVIPVIGTGIGALIGLILSSVKRHEARTKLNELLGDKTPVTFNYGRMTLRQLIWIEKFLSRDVADLSDADKPNIQKLKDMQSTLWDRLMLSIIKLQLEKPERSITASEASDILKREANDIFKTTQLPEEIKTTIKGRLKEISDELTEMQRPAKEVAQKKLSDEISEHFAS